MQRQTAFGMSFDQALETKGYIFPLSTYKQNKKEANNLPFYRLTAQVVRIHSRGPVKS